MWNLLLGGDVDANDAGEDGDHEDTEQNYDDDDDNLHCEGPALNHVLICANSVEIALKTRAYAICLNALG